MHTITGFLEFLYQDNSSLVEKFIFNYITENINNNESLKFFLQSLNEAGTVIKEKAVAAISALDNTIYIKLLEHLLTAHALDNYLRQDCLLTDLITTTCKNDKTYTDLIVNNLSSLNSILKAINLKKDKFGSPDFEDQTFIPNDILKINFSKALENIYKELSNRLPEKAHIALKAILADIHRKADSISDNKQSKHIIRDIILGVIANRFIAFIPQYFATFIIAPLTVNTESKINTTEFNQNESISSSKKLRRNKSKSLIAKSEHLASQTNQELNNTDFIELKIQAKLYANLYHWYLHTFPVAIQSLSLTQNKHHSTKPTMPAGFLAVISDKKYRRKIYKITKNYNFKESRIDQPTDKSIHSLTTIDLQEILKSIDKYSTELQLTPTEKKIQLLAYLLFKKLGKTVTEFKQLTDRQKEGIKNQIENYERTKQTQDKNIQDLCSIRLHALENHYQQYKENQQLLMQEKRQEQKELTVTLAELNQLKEELSTYPTLETKDEPPIDITKPVKQERKKRSDSFSSITFLLYQSNSNHSSNTVHEIAETEARLSSNTLEASPLEEPYSSQLNLKNHVHQATSNTGKEELKRDSHAIDKKRRQSILNNSEKPKAKKTPNSEPSSLQFEITSNKISSIYYSKK